MDDPAACGCTEGDPACWPQPDPCDKDDGSGCTCDDGVIPEKPPGDIGCEDPGKDPEPDKDPGDGAGDGEEPTKP